MTAETIGSIAMVIGAIVAAITYWIGRKQAKTAQGSTTTAPSVRPIVRLGVEQIGDRLERDLKAIDDAESTPTPATDLAHLAGARVRVPPEDGK